MRLSGDNDSVYIFRTGIATDLNVATQITDNGVFGDKNVLIGTVQTSRNPSEHFHNEQLLTGTNSFHIFIIILLIAYSALTFSFKGCIKQLIKAVKPDTNPEQSYNEQTMVFKQYLNYSSLLAIFTSAIFLSKFIDTFSPQTIHQIIPENIQNLTTLIILASTVVIYGYKYIIVKLIRLVTENDAFFYIHRYIGQTSTATGIFFTTPLIILCAIGSGKVNFILTTIVSIMICITYLLFSVRSISFFAKKGVFILQWILYLCAVEIFPVSLLVALALKITL